MLPVLCQTALSGHNYKLKGLVGIIFVILHICAQRKKSGTAPDRAETNQIDDAQAKEVIINSEDQREVRHWAFGYKLLRTAQSPIFDLLVQGGTNGLEAVPLTPSFSLYKGVVQSDVAASLLNSGKLAVSDLIPGEYEGGFKLWECAVDLAKFLCQQWDIQEGIHGLSSSQATQLESVRVLELGCGHGVPGILAALVGAEVHFQDYNEQVLTHLTSPNFIANMRIIAGPKQQPTKQPRFFAGGWASLTPLLLSKGLSGSYDMVFSTDTIYSTEQQQHFINCMVEALKPNGMAFVGAKSYYFGVGGSIETFKQAVRSTGKFDFEVGERIHDGASNIREIILLRRL